MATQEKTQLENSINSVKNRTQTIQEQEETTEKLLMAVFTYNQNTFKDVESDQLKSALNVLYQTIIWQIQILIDHNKYNKLKDVYRSIHGLNTAVDNQPIKILLWKIYNYLKIGEVGEPIRAISPLPPRDIEMVNDDKAKFEIELRREIT
jgi:predicted component of type VI protein secretion system